MNEDNQITNMSSAPYKYLNAGHKHFVRHSISIIIKKSKCKFTGVNTQKNEH